VIHGELPFKGHHCGCDTRKKSGTIYNLLEAIWRPENMDGCFKTKHWSHGWWCIQDAYRNERTQLYESLSKLCSNFIDMNSEQKFVWMFSNEDSIVINEVSKYIYTCYNKRFDILKNTT